jgi:DNA-binding NtrC family response regulator
MRLARVTGTASTPGELEGLLDQLGTFLHGCAVVEAGAPLLHEPAAPARIVVDHPARDASQQPIEVRYALSRTVWGQLMALPPGGARLPRDPATWALIERTLARAGLADRLGVAGGCPLLLDGTEGLALGPLLLAPATLLELLMRLGLRSDTPLGRLERHLERLVPTGEDCAAMLAFARQAGASQPAAAGRPHDATRFTLDDIVGCSPALTAVKQVVASLHGNDATVLLIGESGTGKELFAQAIHAASVRRAMPFLAINCAAIPPSLIESELFGYEDGAFTGARRGGQPGMFERAHGGTVFLDEIGDMPLELQAHLLRLLEERRVLRIGGRSYRPTDVRIVAATNRPLDELTRGGLFRQDLFFRLCVIPLRLPPLRERREDIPLLARHFLAAMGERRSLAAAAWRRLLDYHWPGNIRELRHCLEYMRAMANGAHELGELPPQIVAAGTGARPSGTPPPAPEPPPAIAFDGEEDTLLLELIRRYNDAGQGVGRRRLVDAIRQEGGLLGEGELRTRLQSLRLRGYVQWGAGRGGVKLSAKGQALLRERGGFPPQRGGFLAAVGAFGLAFPLGGELGQGTLDAIGRLDGSGALDQLKSATIKLFFLGWFDQLKLAALHLGNSSWLQHTKLVLLTS